MIEEVDIGGPTLVRAAAKNSPDVLVLTNSDQYGQVITDLTFGGTVGEKVVSRCAAEAWDRILQYDTAISEHFGAAGTTKRLCYGENPHQKGHLDYDPKGPIAWDLQLTPSELSYNNILDLSAAYALASDLKEIGGTNSTSVVIVKHNNPCGVATIALNPDRNPETKTGSLGEAQLAALQRAWEGDPVSAFGGVLVFTDELQEKTALWLAERFVELVSAPGLSKQVPGLNILLAKRRNLKAVSIRQFGKMPTTTMVTVPGGRLIQTSDTGLNEELKSMTKIKWPQTQAGLSRFGIAVCRALKSNAIALVREIPDQPGDYQLVGAGQGQPNRIEALKALAVPRARSVLESTGGSIADCVMVSDAFFPFRDTVETAHEAGIRFIIQPGGSIKDGDSIAACDEFGIAMAFTGVRHFRH